MVEVEAQYKVEIKLDNVATLQYYTVKEMDARVLFEIAAASYHVTWASVEDMNTQQYICQATREDKVDETKA